MSSAVAITQEGSLLAKRAEGALEENFAIGVADCSNFVFAVHQNFFFALQIFCSVFFF